MYLCQELRYASFVIFTIIALAKVDGAGLMMDSPAGEVTVESCLFEQNTALMFGGSLMIFKGTQAYITDCTYRANIAVSNGAGIYAIGTENIVIRTNKFFDNIAGGM